MKGRILRFIRYVCPVLLILGFPCSFIKWGAPDGLHGEGIPIPSVIWDKGSNYRSDTSPNDQQFLDFPNPLAIVLNPIVIAIIPLIIYIIIELLVFITRRLVRNTRKHNK